MTPETTDHFQWTSTEPDYGPYWVFPWDIYTRPVRPDCFVCIEVFQDWRTRTEILADGLFTMYRRER